MTPASLREYAAVQQVGDRFSDETGEWDVVSQPYTTAGGKNAHARVRRVDQPAVVEERTWGAHEHITARRAMSVVRRLRAENQSNSLQFLRCVRNLNCFRHPPMP